MFRIAVVFLIMMLVTGGEGGLNTVFPPYLESQGFTVSRIGFIVSLFGVMQLTARLPSGLLYTGQRARLLLGSALILLAISTAGFAYDGGLSYLILVTLVHGFAFGALTTIMLALVIEIKPEALSSGVVMGWYTASISAGYAIGNVLGGFLAESLGFRPAFAIIGLLPLLAALLATSLPRPQVRLQPTDARAVPAPKLVAPRKIWQLDLGGLTPTIWLAAFAAFYINFLDDAVGTFFPIYGLSIGLSLTTIGLLRSAKSLTATTIRPVSGFFFRFMDYRLVTNLGILGWSLIVLMFPTIHLTWVFLLAFIAIGLSRGLIRVSSATMVAEEKRERRTGLGLASGVYNAGLDLGAFAGPIVAGLLASAVGITMMFRIVPVGLAAAYILATILVTRLANRAAEAAPSEKT